MTTRVYFKLSTTNFWATNPLPGETLYLNSPFLSSGYLLQALVLVSGWQQLVTWIILVFEYVNDESTKSFPGCLCGGCSPTSLESYILMETGQWVNLSFTMKFTLYQEHKSGRKGKEHATTTQKIKISKGSHGNPVTIFSTCIASLINYSASKVADRCNT